MAITLMEKKIAVYILNDWRDRFAEYGEEREEAAREGFRPRYCIHGTDQWTEYDNICGPCEDGLGYWDYLTFLEMSLGEARRIVTHYEKCCREDIEFFGHLFRATRDADRETMEAANELVQKMSAETEKIISRYI